jgi:spore protease
MEMELRTDLAMEAQVLEQPDKLPRGLTVRREQRLGLPATVVEVKTKGAAEALGKPKGTYVTVELGQVLRREKDSFARGVEAVAGYLGELLPLSGGLPVLVAGLGNREVTPDAVGPLTADHILVTRHMLREMPKTFGHFRPVSALVPGVLGTTGVESAETVRALVSHTQAAAVIAVDAIAARDTGRLCSTVQLSNGGITPGSGIGNGRFALDERTLGVPVVALGVPTVTDAATLALDLLTQTGENLDPQKLAPLSGQMIVTSSDIDRRVREISRILAYSINRALQPHLTMQDLDDLTF